MTVKSKKTSQKKKKKLPNEKDQFGFLADLKKIKYYDSKNNKVKTVKFDDWSLLWNPLRKELVGICNKDLCKIKLDYKDLKNLPAMKAHISFQDFPSYQDYDFSKNYISDMKHPIDFELIGKGKEIEYYSDKFNKGDWCLYYHEFGEYDQSKPIVKDHKVMVYYDPYNQLIKCSGGKLTVTERGIIN